MLFCISLPEVSYIRSSEDVLARWFPPKNCFFKFQILEYADGTSFEEIRKDLLISNEVVYLTKDEIKYYKEKYQQ